MPVRGIRGATTVETNTRKDILAATGDLLAEITAANDFQPDDVAAVFFTTTVDLNATFPALAARMMGWEAVPLMCAHEIDVPGSLRQCIRVLVLVNTDRTAAEIRHVYLRGAVDLRRRVAEDLG